jgi:hypothetical protein
MEYLSTIFVLRVFNNRNRHQQQTYFNDAMLIAELFIPPSLAFRQNQFVEKTKRQLSPPMKRRFLR